jgi:hypothetical protein
MALSTDEGKFTNTDGSAKFSDPDDQSPAFTGSVQGNSSGQPLGLSGNAPAVRQNGPTLEWSDGGSSAFNHAYSHQSQ